MNLKAFLMSLFWKQNGWHKHGVLIHTLKVTYQTIKHKDYKFILPALLHDIGKPFVAYQKPEDVELGEYSFTDHEEKSYQLIKNWPFISDWTKDVVRWHYLIRDLDKSKKRDLKRYAEKRIIWDSLSKSMKQDLAKFIKYDDLGKR